MKDFFSVCICNAYFFSITDIFYLLYQFLLYATATYAFCLF